MGGGPVPGEERFVVGLAGEELIENVFNVSPNVEVVAKGTAGQG